MEVSSALPLCLSFVKSDAALIPWYLMSSYLYYIQDISLLQDYEYDLLCKEIFERWDSLDHQHKGLLSKGNLQAGTGFTLRDEDYPNIAKNAAMQLARERGLI